MIWLDYRHPEYREKISQWIYTNDVYTGRFMRPGTNLSTYLIKHAQGEPSHAYSERLRIADYNNLTATVFDGLAGMLFAVEDLAKRDFGDLGDPVDPDSTASRLWRNADGTGANWLTVWQQLTPGLIAYNLYWVLVEGITEMGEASVRIIPPQAVLNWTTTGGIVNDVLVEEVVDPRQSIEDKPAHNATKQYVRYRLEGWERLQRTPDGTSSVIEAGLYEYWKTKSRAERILPIFPVRIPINRDVGYLVARKGIAIFNEESSSDFRRWASNFIRLKIGPDSDWGTVTKRMKDGWNVIQDEHAAYITPSMDPVRESRDSLTQKIRDFKEMAFRAYGDSARERTATEIRQEYRSGVEAFLTLLKRAIDEAENRALFLMEQVYFPATPSQWGKAFAERSTAFMPEGRSRSTQIDDLLRLLEVMPPEEAAVMAGFSNAEAKAIAEAILQGGTPADL